MSLGYFLVQVLNPYSVDVLLHVYADVCPRLSGPRLCRLLTVQITFKTDTVVSIVARRQRYRGLETLHPETASTRIPLLSP